jgi:hypothetical protein
MTIPEDDVFKRIMDNAKDPNYNHNIPNNVDPDWYKPALQRIEEQRQKIIEWIEYCEEQKQKETQIERYCNQILGIKPDYEMTFEESSRLEEENWNARCKGMYECHQEHDFLYEKPEGMTVKEWKEKKRLIKLERKQRERDSYLEITSTPNWLIAETIQKIKCDCMAEGIRNGVTCDTCKLLVKVNDYMMNLFKDAAEGRSSVV